MERMTSAEYAELARLARKAEQSEKAAGYDQNADILLGVSLWASRMA